VFQKLCFWLLSTANHARPPRKSGDSEIRANVQLQGDQRIRPLSRAQTMRGAAAPKAEKNKASVRTERRKKPIMGRRTWWLLISGLEGGSKLNPGDLGGGNQSGRERE